MQRRYSRYPSALRPFEVQWGLFNIPQEVKDCHAALRQLQWAGVPELFDQDVHFFTDGSTTCPKNPCLSLSAWGVVIAEPRKLDGARVVSGAVPGEQQTNNRAG